MYCSAISTLFADMCVFGLKKKQCSEIDEQIGGNIDISLTNEFRTLECFLI